MGSQNGKDVSFVKNLCLNNIKKGQIFRESCSTKWLNNGNSLICPSRSSTCTPSKHEELPFLFLGSKWSLTSFGFFFDKSIAGDYTPDTFAIVPQTPWLISILIIDAAECTGNFHGLWLIHNSENNTITCTQQEKHLALITCPKGTVVPAIFLSQFVVAYTVAPTLRWTQRRTFNNAQAHRGSNLQ